MKKIARNKLILIALFLAFLLALPFTIIAAANLEGDVNGDGILNSADAIYLLRHTIMPEKYPLQSISEDSPEIYAQTYGIVPGNVDMDTMNILLKKASEEQKTIRFGDGIFIFPATIDLPSNISIIGSTNTIFKLSESATDHVLLNVGTSIDNVYISHLTLMSEQTTLPTKQGKTIGLKVSGAVRVNIENVEFVGFDGYGFYGEKMSSNSNGNFYKMIQITNCRFYLNYYGMCLGPRCEYTQVLNCVFGDNNIGCLNQGGNNSYVSCIFNKNITGFQMDSKNLSNPAHGGCNACTFNHNSNPIVINDCSIGWIFSGCQIFYGNIILRESSGVIFDSSIFGSCRINSKHSTLKNANLISDSFFQTDKNIILSENDGSVYIDSCLPMASLPESDMHSPEYDWTQIAYTQKATATAAASENAYFGVLSAPIPQNQDIDMIDIITFGATGENQSIQDVDIWIGNAETGEILEQIVTNETLYTVYSPRAQAYVLRITHEKSYDFPVFIVLEAKRTANRGIAYGRTTSAVNYFSGTTVGIGDTLTANSTYIPEIAIYSIP